MLTGLGSAFNPIAAMLNFLAVAIPLGTFYANMLSYKALQKQQQADANDCSSSANAVSRPVYPNNSGLQGGGGGGRPVGGASQGQGGQGQHGNGQGGGGDRRNNGGNGGGGNDRNHNGGGGNGRNRRWLP
jgi:hypothetical protein